MEDRYYETYTVREIAKQFKVHPYTVRRLARRKKIPAFRFGGQWRFYKSAIEQLARPLSHKHQTSSDVFIP
jgi:excisionase family DNA binding protein